MSYLIAAKLIILVISGVQIISTDGAKILAIYPMPSLSHHILGMKIISELHTRGHEITMVTAYPEKCAVVLESDCCISVENNKNVLSEYSQTASLNKVEKNDLTQQSTKNTPKTFFQRHKHGMIESITFLHDLSFKVTESTLSNQNVQILLKSGKQFDLILMEYFLNEAYFAFSNYFAAPLILTSTLPSSAFTNYLVGNPEPVAYVPHILSPFPCNMNRWERFQNTCYRLIEWWYKHIFMIPKHKQLVNKYISTEINTENLLYNVGLLLVNSHPSFSCPVPHVKNVIEIGGYHVDPPADLDFDLQNDLDESKQGVILFSFGSNLNSMDLPNETIDIFLKSFSKLKQKVYWKWEESDLPKKTGNVKFAPWLNQKDILAHPNVKAFITHGGLLSCIEAVKFGVPIIGIPIFGDQKGNIAKVVEKGYGLMVPLDNITEENLSWALEEILNNPKYKDAATTFSNIINDHSLEPLQNAMYWIEYTLRHKGAPHLKSSAVNLSFYEINLFDIIFLIIFVLVLIITLISLVFIKCYWKCISFRKNRYHNALNIGGKKVK